MPLGDQPLRGSPQSESSGLRLATALRACCQRFFLWPVQASSGITDSYTLALAACDTVDAVAMGFALLAPAAPSPMLTDTGASALLALAALTPMLADTAASTLLALAVASPMLTDTGASALLAPAALSVVLARLRRHRE